MHTIIFQPAIFTISIFTIILLSIFAISALVILFVVINNAQKKTSIITSRDLIKRIVPKMRIGYPDIPSHRVWVETLNEYGYLAPLTSVGNHIVLGTPQMGGTSIFRYLVSRFNTSFPEHAGMCAYVDVNQIVMSHKNTGYVSIEEIYRQVIWSSIKFPMAELESQIKQGAFKRTGLAKLLRDVDGILKSSLSKIEPTTLRQILFKIWQIIGVKRVIYIVDNITALEPGAVPVLLEYMLRTFGRTPSVSFIISGDPTTLVLNKRTNDGNVGAQLSHDVNIALNISEILLSKAKQDQDIYTIRTSYLAKLIKFIQPAIELPEKNNISIVQEFFHNPEAWDAIFNLNNGELENISASIQEVVEYHQSTKKKITGEWVRKMFTARTVKSEDQAGGS